MALHLDTIAGRESMRREPLLHLFGSNGPRRGKAVKLKVFEPHGQSRVRAKRTILSLSGRSPDMLTISASDAGRPAFRD
jgi:hypothetical protein